MDLLGGVLIFTLSHMLLRNYEMPFHYFYKISAASIGKNNMMIKPSLDGVSRLHKMRIERCSDGPHHARSTVCSSGFQARQMLFLKICSNVETRFPNALDLQKDQSGVQ